MEIIHECINKYLTETDNKNKRIKHLKQGYHLFIEQIFKPCNNTSYILTTSACRYDTSLSFPNSIYHHHTNPDTVATQYIDRNNIFTFENNGRVKRKEPEPEPEPNTSFGVSTTRRKKKRRIQINTIKQKRRKHAKKKRTRKRKTRKIKRTKKKIKINYR